MKLFNVIKYYSIKYYPSNENIIKNAKFSK